MRNKKISIRLFIITIVLLLILQVSTSFAETGKSTASNVRIRKLPSTDSEVVDLLAVDEVVEILGKEGDWYRVSFKGKVGYVSQSYISVNGKANNSGNINEQNSNNLVDTTSNNSATGDADKVDNKSVSTDRSYRLKDDTQVSILPTVTSEHIGGIENGASVTVVSIAGSWAYIKSDSISGWVRVDRLYAEDENAQSTNNNDNTDNNSNTTTETNTTTQNQNYTPKTMYTSTSAVNVRSEANTDSIVVDSIGLNAEVRVVGEENGWCKVEVNGRTGYIRNDLLSNEETQVTSRSNGIDRTTAVVSVSNETNTYEALPSETVAVDTSNSGVVEATNESSVPVSASGVSGYDVAEYAKQFLGCSYVYGAAGPYSFDCSGFTMYVYQHFGYSLSHASKVQATQGVPVSGELQPGDILVFSNDGRTVGHVGLYLGDDKFIHASDSTTGVIISNLHDRWNISKYWGARRIL